MSKTANFPQIRVEPEIKSKLECLAQQDGRTLSDYIRRVLERHLQSVECLRELASGPVMYVELPPLEDTTVWLDDNGEIA